MNSFLLLTLHERESSFLKKLSNDISKNDLGLFLFQKVGVVWIRHTFFIYPYHNLHLTWSTYICVYTYTYRKIDRKTESER